MQRFPVPPGGFPPAAATPAKTDPQLSRSVAERAAAREALENAELLLRLGTTVEAYVQSRLRSLGFTVSLSPISRRPPRVHSI